MIQTSTLLLHRCLYSFWFSAWYERNLIGSGDELVVDGHVHWCLCSSWFSAWYGRNPIDSRDEQVVDGRVKHVQVLI